MVQAAVNVRAKNKPTESNLFQYSHLHQLQNKNVPSAEFDLNVVRIPTAALSTTQITSAALWHRKKGSVHKTQLSFSKTTWDFLAATVKYLTKDVLTSWTRQTLEETQYTSQARVD